MCPRSGCCGQCDQSGWGDSNSRLLRPRRSALTRLSYTPTPFSSAYGMTVCTHEVALCDLVEDRLATEASHHHAHLTPLLCAWPVIPGHRCRMKHAAAIDARFPILERLVPRASRKPTFSLLREPHVAFRQVVLTVIDAAA